MWTRARQFSKIFDKRERLFQPPKKLTRYRKESVSKFIEFIVSDIVITDLPFSTGTLKFDDGHREQIPSAVRKLVHEHIINAYMENLRQNNEEQLYSLSRTTYRRILNACSAKTQKSLAGVDIYSYEAAEAFKNLIKIINKPQLRVALDEEWRTLAAKSLKKGQIYLKTDFRTHLKPEDEVPDHCLPYSLSQPAFHPHNQQCNHPHNAFCDRCNNLKLTLQEIQTELNLLNIPHITPRQKSAYIFQVNNAIEAISEYKRHLARTAQQAL